jgi:hypothetical protein
MTKKALSLLFAFVMLFGLVPSAYAASATEIRITAEEMKDGAYYAIEDALQEARYNATDSNIYKIYVPSGTYDLTSCLHIFSNTYLHLESDTKLVKTSESGNMLKSGVQTDSFKGYDGYHNITIEGGIWDSKLLGESCAMRFAHCSGITLKNVTVCNVKNAHHFEAAAVEKLSITGCSFYGYSRSKNVTGEAVQIDVLHSESHFPSYSEYDDTPCRNITIMNCTFNNLFSGIGTRAGVVGSYFTNILVKGNTFTDIKDKAISCFNWRDCVIKENTVNSAEVGIFFEYFPAKNLSTKLYMPNDKSKKISIINDSKAVIKNNDITVKTKSGYTKTCGISVYGGKLSSSQAGSLYAGDYSVKNITIKSNTVRVQSNTAIGIYTTYVKDSAIKNNKITNSTSSKSGNNAINQSNGINIYYYKNTISGKFNNGFAFYSSAKNNEVKANKISNSKEHAIYVEKGSSIILHPDNKTEKIAKTEISINKTTVKPLGKAEFVKVELSKKKPKLSWKKVSGASGYEIYRATSKKGKYSLIKTVTSGKTTAFTDKKAKKGKTCYYKVKAFKKYSGSTVYAENSAVKKIKAK